MPKNTTPNHPQAKGDRAAEGVAHPLPSALSGDDLDEHGELRGHSPSLDELSKRLRGLEGGASDDDLARAIQDNWQKLAGAIVVAFLVIWVINGIRSASEKRAWEAADRLMSAQQSFAAVVKEEANNTADKEHIKTVEGFKQTVEALEKNDSIYGALAKLYSASAALARREPHQVVASKLTSFKTSRFNAGDEVVSQRQPITPADLTDEFAALLEARSLLDANPEQSQEGRKRLLNLAYHGQFLNGEALLAFSRAAVSEEDRLKAHTAATALKSARAEIFEQISSDLQSTGIVLRTTGLSLPEEQGTIKQPGQ